MIKDAYKVCETIIYLLNIRNDIEDLLDEQNYGMTRGGLDIQEGLCAWPLITSLEVATSAQKEVLLQHYGRCQQESVEKVKEVFYDQDILGVYNKLVETNARDIDRDIKNFIKMYPSFPEAAFRGFQLYMTDPNEVPELMTKHLPPQYSHHQPLPSLMLRFRAN